MQQKLALLETNIPYRLVPFLLKTSPLLLKKKYIFDNNKEKKSNKRYKKDNIININENKSYQ